MVRTYWIAAVLAVILANATAAGAQQFGVYVVGAAGHRTTTDRTTDTISAPVRSGQQEVASGLEMRAVGRLGGIAELGAPSLGSATVAIDAILHLLAPTGTKLDPFVVAGYQITGGDRAGTGPNGGLGVVVWLAHRVGVRAEISARNQTNFDRKETYRMFRVGLSLR